MLRFHEETEYLADGPLESSKQSDLDLGHRSDLKNCKDLENTPARLNPMWLEADQAHFQLCSQEVHLTLVEL